MAFCRECGTKLEEDAVFCPNCGAKVDQIPPPNSAKRTQEYAGKVIKCPNCGETLDSFVTVCPACGREIRGAKNSSAVQDFAERMSRADAEWEKIAIIRNYPIPNTKEDILEFAILASTNINENLNLYDEVSDAWFAKLGQAYQKAQVSFQDQPEFDRVKDLYDSVEKEMLRAKRGNKYFEQVSILPNLIAVIGWLLTIFILMPFCRFVSPIAEILIIIDWIFGACIMPRACSCSSIVPKMVTTIGVILNIVIMIPLAVMGGDYQYLIVFDIICSAIILARLFRRNKSEQV